MSSSSPHDQQQTHGHQNCQDCIRQRALNQKYINIYNKMQQLNSKVNIAKRNVNNHQLLMKQTFQDHQKLIQKSKEICIHLSKLNKEHIQEYSYEIAAAVCQQKLKKNIQVQNQQLRNQIRIMSQNREKNNKIDQQLRLSYVCQKYEPQKLKESQKYDKKVQQTKTIDNMRISNMKANNIIQIVQQRQKYLNQTKNSDSQQQKLKNSQMESSQYWKTGFNLSKFGKMNLWLYEDPKNLQKQLKL